MAITPTSSIATPLAALEDMLSASSTWQTAVGAANATEAEAFIEFVGILPPSDLDWNSSRPQAYTWIPNDEPIRYASIGQGVGPALSASGGVGGITIYRNTDTASAATIADASVEFLNWVGTVLDDIRTEIATGAYLMVDEMIVKQWFRASAKRSNSEGDFHRMDIEFRWFTGVGS